MNFETTVKDGSLNMTPAQLELYKRTLASYKDETKVKLSITKITVSHTNQQLKTIFGLAIAQLVQAFDDNGWDSSMLLNIDKPTGVGCYKDLFKEYFYNLYPVRDENGKRITLSKMDIEQAGAYLEQIRNHAASQWSINIAEPDPLWREKNK